MVNFASEWQQVTTNVDALDLNPKVKDNLASAVSTNKLNVPQLVGNLSIDACCRVLVATGKSWNWITALIRLLFIHRTGVQNVLADYLLRDIAGQEKEALREQFFSQQQSSQSSSSPTTGQAPSAEHPAPTAKPASQPATAAQHDKPTTSAVLHSGEETPVSSPPQSSAQSSSHFVPIPKLPPCAPESLSSVQETVILPRREQPSQPVTTTRATSTEAVSDNAALLARATSLKLSAVADGKCTFIDQDEKSVEISDLAELEKCSNLDSLEFNNCEPISGDGLKLPANLTSLTIEGACLLITCIDVSNCRKLTTLTIKSNNVSKIILPKIGDAELGLELRSCINLEEITCTDEFGKVTCINYAPQTMHNVQKNLGIMCPGCTKLNEGFIREIIKNATKLTFTRCNSDTYEFQDQGGRTVQINNLDDLDKYSKINHDQLEELRNEAKLAQSTELVLTRCENNFFIFENRTGVEIKISDLNALSKCRILCVLVFKCNGVETLDLKGCKCLQSVNLSDSSDLVSLVLPNENGNQLASLDISCTKIHQLDARKCTNLTRGNITTEKCLNSLEIMCSKVQTRNVQPPLPPFLPGFSGQSALPPSPLFGASKAHPLAPPPFAPGQPLPVTAQPSAAVSISRAVPVPPFTETQREAQHMMHEILGENFDQYNGEVDNIDFSDVAVTNKGCKAAGLVAFTKMRHPHCMDIFRIEQLNTKAENSVCRRHYDILIKKFPDAEDYSPPEEGGRAQGDFSQITDGTRAYYLTCAPNEQRSPREFFTVFEEEIGNMDSSNPKPLAMIVDLHTANRSNFNNDTDDYLTECGVEGLTDVNAIKEVEIPRALPPKPIRIQIRTAKINGKEFIHVRVHNWSDGTALEPDVVQQINAEIEELCKKHGIQKMVVHCNGGVGRASTMMYANALERIAKETNASGKGCCCDWDQQTLPEIDGKINLAYVMRNMALTGHAIRSTCGQTEEQFKFYKQFTEDMARVYEKLPAA